MKNLMLIGFILLLTSCVDMDTARLEVRNELSNITMENVKWRTLNISRQILPGQSAEYGIGSLGAMRLPDTHPLEFNMNLNDESVRIQTSNRYTLDSGEDLVIVIDSTTKLLLVTPLESQK